MSEVGGLSHHAHLPALFFSMEVGRGTATFDGLSIAWAVSSISRAHPRAYAFATHYHELTELADLLPAVKNVHVPRRRRLSEIIFLRRVEPAALTKSYVSKWPGSPACLTA